MVIGGVWSALADAQVPGGATRSLFGIALTGKAAALLEEVEQLFGHELREELTDDPEGMSGRSKVDHDGVPTISVDRYHGKQIDVIVHELYHLKLRAQGYPTIFWLYPRGMNNAASRAGTAQLAAQVHDPIEHYLFYETVRSWGINPGETFEKHTAKMLADDSLAALYRAMDDDAAALYYFKVRLEVADSPLLHNIQQALRSAGKESSIEFGEKLSELVIDAKPNSPRKAMEATIDVLNMFYKGRFIFAQRPWITVQLGKNVQRRAQIQIVLWQ